MGVLLIAANKAAQDLDGKIHTIMADYGYETLGPDSRTELKKPDYHIQKFDELLGIID